MQRALTAKGLTLMTDFFGKYMSESPAAVPPSAPFNLDPRMGMIKPDPSEDEHNSQKSEKESMDMEEDDNCFREEMKNLVDFPDPDKMDESD